MSAQSQEKKPAPAELATPRGPKQEPSEQLLFRNVAEAHFVDGKPDQEAFVLRSRDRGLMSVSLESKTTAQAAYELRLKHTGKHSAGLWAVSVQECSSSNLDAYSDPAAPPDDPWVDPAHGGIDFRVIITDKKQKLARQKELLDFAINRGPAYQPTQAVTPPPQTEE